MTFFIRILFFISISTVLAVAPVTAACPLGDLNGNCSVNLYDFSMLSSAWMSDPVCSGIGCPDLNGDNIVDRIDLMLLAGNWLDSTAALVINEFMAKNDSWIQDEHGDLDDWIEIYNYGDKVIDIGGMYLTDDLGIPTKWQVPANDPATILLPGDFVVIWADSEPLEGTLHASFSLGAGGEEIGLYDADLNQIDAVVFGAQNGNESFGRCPDGSDTWQVFLPAGTLPPTPGFSNCGPPEIVISEIMYHPEHRLDDPLDTSEVFEAENLGAEYIELFNQGVAAVNLTGWRFSNGVDFIFPNVTIAAGQYLIVAADLPTFRATYDPGAQLLAVGGWVGRLSNSGEDVELVDDQSVRIDQVGYGDEGDWARRALGPLDHTHRGWRWSDDHDGDGKSLELLNLEMPNEHGQNWAASLVSGGTPGAVNSVASANIAPLVIEVEHFPLIPSSSDVVTVTARIIDESAGGVTATVYYRGDTSAYTEGVYTYNTGGYSSVVMLDDGAHGDGEAGDGLYGAIIDNPSAQANGTVVEFYVQASDVGANTRTWPAPVIVDDTPMQAANLLYQVDDSFDPDWVPGSPPIYYLIMTEAERAELQDIGDDGAWSGEASSNAQMNSTFISTDGVDLKIRYNVGLRNRGKSSRATPPMNYRVNFPHDNNWEGVTAINLNSQYWYCQVLGSAIFRMAGIATSNAAPVNVRVNSANLALASPVMYGLYAAVEALDSDWANRHFPDDDAGNLYRCKDIDIGDREADLGYLGPVPDIEYRYRYYKQTNAAADNWSGVIQLTDMLNNAAPATYFADVDQIANLDQWTRFLAVNSLIGNHEGGLDTGRGDDFAMYRGVVDPRFSLVPHDLDTIMSQGDHTFGPVRDIFDFYKMVDGLEELLSDPQVAQLYYCQFLNLMDTVFAPENLDPLVDQVLGGLVPQTTIDAIKQFNVGRIADVHTQIPQALTAVSSLPVVSGFPQSTNGLSGLISGQFDSCRTLSVLANGVEVSLDGTTATWSQSSLTLNPGINRVVVQAFDGLSGTGSEIERTFIDIWYDDSSLTNLSGTLASNTTLTAAAGPWRVIGNVTVPAGITLTIEAGTTVYFDAGMSITVNGRIVAQGTEYERIRLTRQPGVSGTWNGIHLSETTQNNVFSYVDLDYADTSTGSISMTNSVALIENMSFAGSERIVIKSGNSSAIIRNSVFADLFPSYDPTGVNIAEQIVASNIPAGGYFIIENNLFGTTSGHNDVIDFSSPSRPNPIVQILNNTFMGTGDEMLDLGGDALIEGNLFMHEHKDVYNIGTGESNVISTGDNISGGDATITVVRNVFYDVDHAVNLKNNTFMYFENNVVANVADGGSAIKFGITNRDAPGKGVHVDGCIFWDLPIVFENVDQNTDGSPGPMTDLEMHYSLVSLERCDDVIAQRPGTILDLGTGNICGAPHFVDDLDDFALRFGSPALGTGPNGLDMGAMVPAGASISGEPAVVTYLTSASLTVGGPKISDYKYRVNAGLWSGQISVAVPITLVGLSNGDYTVEVIGLNYAGIWQEEADATASQTWTVDTSHSRLIINEVLAHTHGNDPDIIELYNDGLTPIDMSGMSISDDLNIPTKYIFPPGTSIASEEYKIYYADAGQVTPDYLGFALSAEGEGLYLYDNGGVLIDSIEFGLQINDVSIGRLRDDQWYATVPTLGLPNVAQALGDPTMLRINEWLTSGDVLFADDFIEIYNPDELPVDLSNFYLTDDPVARPQRHQLSPLSFVPAAGFGVVLADSSGQPGHVDFGLSADQEMIGLYDAGLNEIDKVLYYSQTTDVSQGCEPDGTDNFVFFELPTPGVSNTQITLGDITLVAEGDAVSYLVPTVADAAADWTHPTFNDQTWGSGQTPLGFWDMQSSWTTYNDCVYSAGQYKAPNATTYGIGTGNPHPTSGELLDLAAGSGTGVTVTFSQSGGVDWDEGVNGGFDTNPGTDAHDIFSGTTDMTGVIRYSSSPDWWVDVIFSNLNPSGVYTFVTSANRGNLAYTDRITKYTISDADAYTNASSPGTINGPDSTSFSTGANTVNGYVAKWTGIRPGVDGIFRIRAEADNPALQYKAYAFDVFMLEAAGIGGSDLRDDMLGINSSLWTRIKFDIEQQTLNLLNSMTLQMKYEDAFVAYLNGTEVAGDNFTGTPVWNSDADSNRSDELALTFVDFDISGFIGNLMTTDNVLAIQALNDINSDPNFIVSPVLFAQSDPDNDPRLLLDNLRITEMMYNPVGGSDYEFIELQNIGINPIELGGVRFTNGIDFTFPVMTLGPGDYVVVVSNQALFESRYGTAINVAGEYTMNLSNGGEEILLNLPAPLDAAILRFDYSDTWYPETDGSGYSLVIVDPYEHPSTWRDPMNWRPSNLTGGSPGSSD